VQLDRIDDSLYLADMRCSPIDCNHLLSRQMDALPVEDLLACPHARAAFL
jgi:hypothetical protein